MYKDHHAIIPESPIEMKSGRERLSHKILDHLDNLHDCEHLDDHAVNPECMDYHLRIILTVLGKASHHSDNKISYNPRFTWLIYAIK